MRAKILTLFVLLLLAGCSSVPSLVYKIEIQQGNIITQEMVDKLKPGMTRSQVRFALGSPMISDVFHNNRWDYVYRLEQKGALVEQRHLTVFFEDDKIVRLSGSFSPSIAFASPQPVDPTRAGANVEDSTAAAVDAPALRDLEMSSLQQMPPPQAAILPQPVDEAIKPVIQEGGIPALSATPPKDIPASSSVSASDDTPVVSKAPVSPEPKPAVTRQMPSQAGDRGSREADLPKE
jgi:outer membrane protein assembly factor BamE